MSFTHTFLSPYLATVTLAAMDRKWTESWARLAAANDQANRERLCRLTTEEALREFEALCREVHTAFDSNDPMPARTHAVGLSKFWKSA